jgi:hypothetical protein
MRRGFILVSSAMCMVGLFALVGLATDVVRLYVSHDELQVFLDEAALAASFELDGTSKGLTRAQTMALAGPGSTPNRWYFGSRTVSGVTVQFASAPAGPFNASPPSPSGQRFIRLQVTAAVNLYFLPLVPGMGSSQNITVSSVAGQCQTASMGDGLSPFSPDAHNPTDPNFGFLAGQLYTIRWPSPGVGNKDSCPGDVGFTPPGGSDRGYIDVGQGTGGSSLESAIVDNNFALANPLTAGSALTMVSGQKSISSSIQTRFNQDSDTTAASFSAYKGNGRRLLTVPVNNGASPASVAGFALFFLQPSPCGNKNSEPCCAEYVGPAVVGSTHQGAGSAGLYQVQLVQ